MSKIRIYQLAKELSIDTSDMLEVLDNMGVAYKSHASTLDEETAAAVLELINEQRGLEAKRQKEQAWQALPHRAPVVAIMGHVDHGKTSLLDYLRKSHIADKEAGGITQHIGAFEVETKGGRVVFIDTPGHEAFTSIRERGAKVADIAVVVIAADDGIMPQTKEAIAHAKAADIPILFAVSKIDLPSANLEKVNNDLMREGLVPEAFGGDVVVAPISSKTGEGIPNLLDTLLLMAEMEDLRADPGADPVGVIVESRLDRQAGVLVTIIVQQGAFSVGDYLVAGESWGKIKAMITADGARVKSTGPSTPVQILGFSGMPAAGEQVEWVPDDQVAKEIAAEGRNERAVQEVEEADKHRIRSMADLLHSMQGSQKKEINLVLRCDAQGSLEAIRGVLARESTDEVEIKILLAAIGAPTEADILLASTAQAAIFAFGVNPSGPVRKAAEHKRVVLRSFRVIYDLIDEIEAMVKGETEPEYREEQIGQAEVRALFKLPKGGVVAGCMVVSGKITRSAKARVLRGKEEIWRGSIEDLKRFKDDVREVAQGYECGIRLAGFDDFKVGDMVEATQLVEVLES